MGETFKKALELAESASRTISEASRDIATEIEKASKVIEDGIRTVEQVADQGAKLNENLQRTIIDLQKDFHDIRNVSEKLIVQTKTSFLCNIDFVKFSIENVLNSNDVNTNSQISEIKNVMFTTFEEIKSQIQLEITNLHEILHRALQNAQRLIEVALDAAVLLKNVSEKTLLDAQARVKTEFIDMAKVAEDLTKRCAKDFSVISDVLAQEILRIVDQIKSMVENSATNIPDAKVLLEKVVDEIKLKLDKSIDSVKSDISKSINQIQKHSEKSLNSFQKSGEKFVDDAQKSVD